MNERGPEHQRLIEHIPTIIAEAIISSQYQFRILLLTVCEGRVVETVRKGEEIFDPRDEYDDPVSEIELSAEDSWKLDSCYSEAEDDIVRIAYELEDDIATGRYQGKQFEKLLLPAGGDRVLHITALCESNLPGAQAFNALVESVRGAVSDLPDIWILMKDTQTLRVSEKRRLIYEDDGQTEEFVHDALPPLPAPGTSVYGITVLLSVPNDENTCGI